MTEISEDDARAALTRVENRKRDYQLCFKSAPGNEVLKDLVVFCRGAETCAVPGDRDRTFLLEGRREVFLRIQQHLNLTNEDLFRLATGLNIIKETDSE